jgi:hypothetical protein
MITHSVSLKNSTVNWSKLLFPVYPIRTAEYIRNEGTKLVIRDKYGDKIIDDTSLEGSTLGIRRIRIDDEVLYRLTKAVNSVRDVIQLNGKAYKWIDSRGTLFEYNKTHYVPLIYKPIEYVKYVDGAGSVVKGEGLPPFKLDFPLDPELKYIGVLKESGGYLLWDLCKEPKKNSTRLI